MGKTSNKLTDNESFVVLIQLAKEDKKIKEMIEEVLENKDKIHQKLFLITEDKGFKKISKKSIFKVSKNTI